MSEGKEIFENENSKYFDFIKDLENNRVYNRFVELDLLASNFVKKKQYKSALKKYQEEVDLISKTIYNNDSAGILIFLNLFSRQILSIVSLQDLKFYEKSNSIEKALKVEFVVIKETTDEYNNLCQEIYLPEYYDIHIIPGEGIEIERKCILYLGMDEDEIDVMTEFFLNRRIFKYSNSDFTEPNLLFCYSSEKTLECIQIIKKNNVFLFGKKILAKDISVDVAKNRFESCDNLASTLDNGNIFSNNLGLLLEKESKNSRLSLYLYSQDLSRKETILCNQFPNKNQKNRGRNFIKYKIIRLRPQKVKYSLELTNVINLKTQKRMYFHIPVDVPIGGSRIGGKLIDVPQFFDFPNNQLFLAQLNLSHLSQSDPYGLLPKRGFLYFFVGQYLDKGTVIYCDVEANKLKRDVRRKDECWDSCDGFLVNDIFIEDEDIGSRYRREDNKWDYFAGSDKSKIYGIYTHCQMDEEHIIEVSNDPHQILLLQIGEDFTDDGVLSVFIERDSLLNRKFENCRFIWGQT